jgi:hypothetical protein
MKKVFCILLAFIVMFAISGCGKKEKIELTSENMRDYIILDVQLDDYEKESKDGLFITNYRGTATLNATAKLKKNVDVEDVVIKCKITTSGSAWALNVYEFTLELDKNGEATYSKEITSGNYGITPPDEPSISRFYSYELQDGEFFYNEEEKILITEISGSVYD